MAILHQATLTPTKLDLVIPWLASRPWCPAGVEVRGQVGSFRLDDPAGEVGVEGLLLDAGPSGIVHVPLTYRAAPVEAASGHLLGTMEHSVLGTRWVYDACADPVWAAGVLRTIASGGAGAEEVVQTADGPRPRQPSATVRGSGVPGAGDALGTAPVAVVEAADGPGGTVVRADGVTLLVTRILTVASEEGVPEGGDHRGTLTGSWDGGSGVLVALP